MKIDKPEEHEGGWTAAAHGARAAELLSALDPKQRFVVIEGHAVSTSEWEALPIILSASDPSATSHTVRNLRFDLLLSPQEAVANAARIDAGFPTGALFAWQSPTSPPSNLRLLELDGRAYAAAKRGAGVSLIIDLPHSGETAVLWSPSQEILMEALARLEG